jgi:energy-coupling factor transport system substrate-specific component
VVALVGTLAAFAALGRVAFAAVPNVKPTTDIVLVAGFALGGGPGFAVGAIAGLASNFFFGQGPWTPWQMAAWGATGVLGALLARAVPRHGGAPHLGRVTLAVVCGLAGFAFTVVQDVGDWVTYSDHSAAQLGAYVGQGLGFDALHAAGCVAFALAFGPALVRSIQRFARRIEVTWIPPAAVPALLVAVCAAALAGGASHPAAARAAGAPPAGPGTYLRSAQNADGGLGAAPGQPSAQLFSGWGALGLAAGGVDIATVRAAAGRPSLLDDVRGGAVTGDVGALERTILVARAGGQNPSAFGGRDLVAALVRRFDRRGAVSGQVNLTAFGLLALRAAGTPGTAALRRRAAAWLVAAQDRDGGYGFEPRGDSDADDTGAVLEALGGQTAAGAARARGRAVTWLRRHQDRDGGFASAGASSSNAQSTAWAVQGLIAAGTAPASLQSGGRTPIAYLRSLIAPDGAVAYARGELQTPVWVTGEALMALAGRPLPLAAPASAAAHLRGARAPAPPTPAASAAIADAVTHMADRVSKLPAAILAGTRIGT